VSDQNGQNGPTEPTEPTPLRVWRDEPDEPKNEWNLDLTMPSEARGFRVTVVVSDAGGNLLATDEGNLMSLTTRKRMTGRLAGALHLDETKAATFGELLEKTWLQFYADYQERISAGPAQQSAADLLAEMPEEIRLEAEAMLHDPALVAKIGNDLCTLGIAGEALLAMVILLVGVSRLLLKPLSARVHGPSTSGKSYIVSEVASLFPPETVLFATQMTPQALFHMPPGALVHRFIVGGERSRLENDQSAEATRALREMITAGKLSKLMPVKVGGGIVTQLIEQDGPIAFIETTTLARVFDEDATRCLTLYTDERKEQTERIVKTLAGRYARGSDRAAAERLIQKRLFAFSSG
jgi:hypothetical protein